MDSLEDEGHPALCPFCGSDDTEPHALFGSALLMTQHYCRACRSVFERIRGDEPDEDTIVQKGE